MSALRKRKTRRGFTLVELLVATSVIAFATLGIASMFPTALSTVMTGGQRTKATMLALEMIDMIRSDSFDAIQPRYNDLNTNNLPGATCPAEAYGFSGPSDYLQNFNKLKWRCDLAPSAVAAPGQGLPAGYGRVSVACVDANGMAGSCSSTDVRRVIVTVYWGLDVPRSVSLATNVVREY
jgi:prepilin-type N-terminal cleavage/methylation domain-containing protein